MDTIISVENIKCAGCVNSIRQHLAAIPGLLSVEVDIPGESVLITADRDVRTQAIDVLARLGYPEKGSSEGLDALGAKAKSFVSCALGKLSSKA